MENDIRRIDALEKVTGDAIYPSDTKRSGLLVGKILHSPVTHGFIKGINTDKAIQLPGVVAVITGSDFPDVISGMIIQDERVMAKEKVRYYGEALAAVAAIDEQTAEKALELIELDIEELPGIFSFSESVRPEASLIHEGYETYTTTLPVKRNGNICLQTTIEKGSVEEGFANSDLVVEDTYTVPVVFQATLEPRSVIAECDHAGKLHLWCCTARPFAVQEEVAHVLKRPMSEVRITALRVGGHFGGKGESPIEPIAAMLALKAQKPIKLEMSRKGDFLMSNPRHSMEITIKTGVTRDGLLLARQAVVKSDTGAYSYFGPSATSNAIAYVAGPYRIANVHLEGICAYTNKMSCGPCRAPGAPQAHFAGESQMDRIARELDMDPVELRLKNALREGDSTHTGQVLDYVGYYDVLVQLRKSVKAHLDNKDSADKNKSVGIGIASGFWGMSGMGSSATIKLNQDGTAVLSTGAVEIGAGSNTVMAILVADGLGIPREHVKVVSGDTDTCPYDFGAIGSRTTQAMGVAVHDAIQAVKEQLLDIAETLLKTPKEGLRLGEGRIFMDENPETAIPIGRAVNHLMKFSGGPVIATGRNTVKSPPFSTEKVRSMVAPSRPFFCFGAQAVAVEVDRTTGKVDVLKVVAVHNVGKAIFPAGVEGQIQGGVAMGLGYALSEEVIFSDGKPLNDSFLDYRVPTMEDIPEIVPIIVEKENARFPEDVRGIGEPPTIPTAAAVANAVFDAVGIRLKDLPLTSEKVFWGLKQEGPAEE